ncbi:MAG: fasciclin domain-containing protein [Blastocatellia bacterium]
MKSVYRVAAESGRVTTWIAAVEVAGLVELLKGDDYLTVFAPADEAFTKLSSGGVEGLLANLESLVAMLCYHIVPGKIMAGELSQLNSLRTLSDDELLVETGRELFVNEARVIQSDIVCRNGVSLFRVIVFLEERL